MRRHFSDHLLWSLFSVIIHTLTDLHYISDLSHEGISGNHLGSAKGMWWDSTDDKAADSELGDPKFESSPSQFYQGQAAAQRT